MLEKINFLDTVPKIARDITARASNKEENRRIAMKFGAEYFDGPREQGYGGYVYDGRWRKVARKLIAHYKLEPGHRVLDVGCAKGFLVHDMRGELPGIEVVGIDISDYALRNAHPAASGELMRADCRQLPFASASFDLVLAINTVHNLDPCQCKLALHEITRVSKGAAFVQVDSYRTEAERALFEDWMLTARTYLTPEGWLDLFSAAGYKGDYYWTILQSDGHTA